MKIVDEGIEDVVLDNKRLIKLSKELAEKIKMKAASSHLGLWYLCDYELSKHVLGEVAKFRSMVCEEVKK